MKPSVLETGHKLDKQDNKAIKGTLPFFRLLSAMPAGLPRTVFDDIPHHVIQRQIKG